MESPTCVPEQVHTLPYGKFIYLYATRRHFFSFIFLIFWGVFWNPFFFFFPHKRLQCWILQCEKCCPLHCLLHCLLFNSFVAVICCSHTAKLALPNIFTPLRRVLWLNSAAARCQCSFTWELVFHWTQPKHIKFFKNLGNLPVVKFSITHHSCSSLDRAVLLQCLAICALRTCWKGKQSLHLFLSWDIN